MTPASAVTLDLWHTLVYLTPPDEEAYMNAQLDLASEVLEEGPPLPGVAVLSRPELRATFEKVYAEAVAAAQRGVSMTPSQQLALAAQRAGRAARPERYVEHLFGLVARTGFREAPGALASVRALRERGWRTAVISNTVGEPGAALRPVLRGLGFDRYVEEYVFSDQHPWTKPDPAIFEEAMRRLGVEDAHTVHVGDGWSDIEGARRARLRAGILYTGLQSYGARYASLFLPPGWAAPSAEYRIDRLEELPPLVGRLLAPRSEG